MAAASAHGEPYSQVSRDTAWVNQPHILLARSGTLR